ncbi:MAG: hypothetical protein JWQ97_1486 [Phenylobacterium sp.]|nr:hypothetical protein [Phenylobacterium sp.]
MQRQRVGFQIEPSGFDGASWDVAGWLSAPPGGSDTLLVLVHGSFYTHLYWDFPYQPEVYSFVAWAYERGFATLNIDRLGAGESSHPPGLVLDLPRNAEALHQVIRTVRDEGVAGVRFERVVAVGHSLGSYTAGLMQADSGSADAVVLTGSTGLNVIGVADTPQARESFQRRFTPVLEDPRFAERTGLYDGDYVTMPTERLARAFYRSPPADERLIEINETLKGTMTAGESRTMGISADACARISAPVLVQVGLYDAMYYDPRRRADLSEIYARAVAAAPANFTFDPPVPDTGHNLALHPNARASYERIAAWLQAQRLV